MGKSFLHRWFGWGRVPEAMVPILEAEGIVFRDEGLWASVRFRNYRAPGKRYSRRINSFVGALVVTRLRLVAFQGSQPIINVPLELVDKLCVSVHAARSITIGFEAADFSDDATGWVECRFRTLHAAQLGSLLER